MTDKPEEQTISRTIEAGGGRWRFRAYQKGTTIWTGFEFLDDRDHVEPVWRSAREWVGEVPLKELERLQAESASEVERMVVKRNAAVDRARRAIGENQ